MQALWSLLSLCILSYVIPSRQQHRLFYDYPRSKQEKNNLTHTILIDVLIRDQECSLPYWLRNLQSLHCPGSCDVRISSLGANKALADAVARYIRQNFNQFSNVELSTESNCLLDVTGNKDHYDYLFYLTSDHFILNRDTLSTLIAKKKLLVSPLLNVLGDNRASEVGPTHSFAVGLAESIEHVLSRNILGCFTANITDLPVLVDLQLWRRLVKEVPCGQSWLHEATEILHDEQLESHLCNRDFYGYMPDTMYLSWTDTSGRPELSWELRCQATEYMLLEHQLRGPNKTYLEPLSKVNDFEVPEEARHQRMFTLEGIDKVYVINLRRRKDRLDRTKGALDILNISAQVVEAYDGLHMTLDDLKEMNVKTVEPYIDPYNKRSINLGEVACSLSHHWVWKDAEAHNYKQIIVLEDDARFGLLFKYRLNSTLEMLSRQNIKWDMIYLGRKIMNVDERFLPTVPTLVRPNYSHWTVAYMLSRSGIMKLMKQNFPSKILPVDEFLPLMYDQQPMEYLKEYFPDREIFNTFAFQPGIIQPTHYYGEPSYVSDTENTTVVL